MINEQDVLYIDLADFASYWQSANWGGENNLDTVLTICQHYLRQSASLGRTVDKETIQLWLVKRIKEAQEGGREFAPQFLSEQLRLWNVAEANYVPRVTATIGITATDIWFAGAEAPEGYTEFWVYKQDANGTITRLGQMEDRTGDWGYTHDAAEGDNLFIVTQSGVAYSVPSALNVVPAEV